MKKNIFSFLFLLLFLVLAVSCSEASVSGKTYLITIGDDYCENSTRKVYVDKTFKNKYWIRYLGSPMNDCKAISDQISILGNLEPDNFFNEGSSCSYTWSDVEDCIKGLQIKAEDLLILFYSGHGLDDGSLVTRYDDGSGDVAFELISPEKVLGLLSSIPGYKVFISDSCFSGNFVVDSTIEDSKNYEGTSFVSSSPSASFKASFKAFNIDPSYKNKYPNTWALSAVTAYTESPDGSYGILAESVLLYLGAKKDGGVYKATTSNKGKTLTLYDMYKSVFNNYKSEGYIESYTPLVTRSPEDVILFGR